jgi:hypothetical protein
MLHVAIDDDSDDDFANDVVAAASLEELGNDSPESLI